MDRIPMPRRPVGLRALSLAVVLFAAALSPVAAVAQQPADGAAQEAVILNFKDADIQAVIALVSERTGMNFIVDPRVKGRVTVISNQPMTGDELYQVFLSMLKIHGFAAIPGVGAVKIVPEVYAKQDEVPTVSARAPGTGDEFVTRVVQIQHVEAAQLVPILRPLVPQRGHLAALPESNVLIISDSAGNISRLVDIIERVDQGTTGDVEVIPLQHASAAEVVRILTALEAGEGRQRQRIQVVADERSNSVLVGGDPARRLRIRALISHLDTPVRGGGNTQVIYLRYAKAPDLVPVLTGIAGSIAEEVQGQQNARQAAAGTGGLNIQAHESTNALVISGPPDVLNSLRAVIQQLDVRRAQVLVEAVIAEVSSEKESELGVQWGALGGNGVGIVNFGRSGTGLVNLAAGAEAFRAGAVAAPPPIGDGLSLGLGHFVDGALRLGALVRTLAGDASSNILSTPTLVTMDNEEAEIVVGQNVPFRTGEFVLTGGATPQNPFTTIQRQDVGLSLKIRPQINEGNAIKLDIEQEVSSISPSPAGAADLITNKRALRTSVMVDDGAMIVLGGLIDDELRESVQKVPGLGDIPILGGLFRYNATSKTKRNLMVFLHPRILRDAALQEEVTSAKYNYIRGEQMRVRERGVALMPDSVAPVLPELNEFLVLPPPYDEARGRSAAPMELAPPRDERLD